MLVLSRKEGEGIVLLLASGESIKIELTKYKGVNTKVSIDAPDSVIIFREELISRKINKNDPTSLCGY